MEENRGQKQLLWWMTDGTRAEREEPSYLDRCDADLLRRAQQGDEAAYHEMVDRYGAELYRLAYSLVGNSADAEDVVQETFAGAFRHARRFEGRAAVRTWLVRILVRQAARQRHSRARGPSVSLNALDATDGGEAKRVDHDARMDIAALLEKLPAIHRDAIVLRELEGMTYDEMADALDVPRGTVESRLFRARQTLKELLKDYAT